MGGQRGSAHSSHDASAFRVELWGGFRVFLVGVLEVDVMIDTKKQGSLFQVNDSLVWPFAES